MRAVIQRVTSATVSVEGEVVGAIGEGMVVLLGVAADDTEADIRYLVEKLPKLRFFRDEAGKMNRSVVDIRGEILVVSQFTLYGDLRGSNRPGFERAAPAEWAETAYEKVVSGLREGGLTVATGRFRTTMAVSLCNDGPVTLLLDSRKNF